MKRFKNMKDDTMVDVGENCCFILRRKTVKNIIVDFEQIDNIIKVLSSCTDDYLFIYDMKRDFYTISDRAAEVFLFDEVQMNNASAKLMSFVYPEDRQLLMDDLEKIAKGEKADHNLEYRWLDKNGDPIWISCRARVLLDKDGRENFLVGRISELGRRNKIDNVTGLYCEEILRADIMDMSESEDVNGFMLLIGVDNLKDINEKYGKIIGDKILFHTAECIKNSVQGIGSVYRMDGDEIMIFCKNLNTSVIDPAKELYDKIQSGVNQYISKSGYQIFYTISGGSIYFDDKSVGDIQLIEKAEFSLREAKKMGKNACVRYSSRRYEDYLKRLDMQEELRKAVENDFEGFELFFQPIVNVKKKSILGAEALIRWNNDKFGHVSPGAFIPLLEESGLIIPVGRWIIMTAMKQCQKWQDTIPEFRVNINLSFVQINKSDVIRDIDTCMENLNFNFENVLFEITESGELEGGGITQNILKSFRTRNLNLAIDDFGTGYSNLKYIKEMMFDLVKIDQSFIRNIKDSQYDYMVVKQFTELAHSLNLKVCYEGVETYEDYQCVLELEPDYIQGFYFARPVPVPEFEEKYLGTDNLTC